MGQFFEPAPRTIHIFHLALMMQITLASLLGADIGRRTASFYFPGPSILPSTILRAAAKASAGPLDEMMLDCSVPIRLIPTPTARGGIRA